MAWRYALSFVTTVDKAGAEGVRWDQMLLARLVQAMKERVEAAVAAAASFRDRWPADSIAAIDAANLVSLLRGLFERTRDCLKLGVSE